jgi:hypothetical protein
MSVRSAEYAKQIYRLERQAEVRSIVQKKHGYISGVSSTLITTYDLAGLALFT